MNTKPHISNFDLVVIGNIEGPIISCRRVTVDDFGTVVAHTPDEPMQEGEFFSAYRWDADNHQWEWMQDEGSMEAIRQHAVAAAGTDQPYIS